ncbi:hypothetical protein [Halopiger djelfimassiliensis]|uniref:hypothetical protein n=1 Tax=Halopiger djelfimassiliensis TaxID=1293047 RepID=UPI000AD7B557|nr:hypothetical protein [Halopiger djelfimassiliensis]
MSTDDAGSSIDVDRRMARTTAIGLGVWLTLTFAAVLLLLLFGGTLASVFV